MDLHAMTIREVLEAREWRNMPNSRLGLRTPYMLTEDMQKDFYNRVICNRDAHHRYWSVRDNDERFVAMVGLTDIQWENGLAEISLITDPEHTRQGIGEQSVALVLDEAFGAMRLLTVFGECYQNNPAVGFWEKMIKKRGGSTTILPRRKWWEGQLWDSLYFTFTR